MKYKFKYIDLFAGIGGFHQAMNSVGGKCVFVSEWDKHARMTYEANYKNDSPEIFENNYQLFNCDINDANPTDIPNFDICCAGFPCQPFSIAGLRKGFEDTRGTLFFNIANIINEKIQAGSPPKVLFLENVKGLRNHQRGETLNVILSTLDELGYRYKYDVLNAKYFGIPQNRERLFIVAWFAKTVEVDDFRFPFGLDAKGRAIYEKKGLEDEKCKTLVSDIFEPKDTIDTKYTISDRMWEGHQKRKERNRQNGKGFGYSLFKADSVYCSTISARYWKDGSEILIDQSHEGKNPRRLTPVEAGRLQGYHVLGNGWENPKCIENHDKLIPEFRIVVSSKEAYRQFGNSVAVPVIKAITKEIVEQLLSNK